MGAIDDAVKKLAGDAWDETWAEKLTAASKTETDTATKAAVSAATDDTKAKLVASKKAAAEAKAKADELEAQLASAGKTDEAVAAALKKAAEAQEQSAKLAVKLKVRDIRDAAVAQLAEAKVEERRIPEAKRAAALRLLDFAGVDLDESGSVVGLAAKVEALQTECPWLWDAAAAAGDGDGDGTGGTTEDAKGNGGPAAGSEKPAGTGPKKTPEEIQRERGAAAVRATLQKRGALRPAQQTGA